MLQPYVIIFSSKEKKRDFYTSSSAAPLPSSNTSTSPNPSKPSISPIYVPSIEFSENSSLTTTVALDGKTSMCTINGHSYYFADEPYDRFRKALISQRGFDFNLSKKTKQQLSEIETLLYSHSIVDVYWTPDNQIKCLLDSSHLVSFCCSNNASNIQQIDLESISVDKSILQNIKNMLHCGVLFEDFYVMGPDENKIFLLTNTTPSSTNLIGGIVGTGNNSSVKISQCVLPASTVAETIKVNSNKKFLCAQFLKSTCLLAQIIYNNSDGEMHMQVLGNYLNVSPNIISSFEFSNAKPNVLHVIETSDQDSKDLHVLWNIFEISNYQFTKKHSRRVELSSRAVLSAIGPSERHLVCCCEDGSIHLFTSYRLSLATTSNQSFSAHKFRHISVNQLLNRQEPFILKWHSDGTIFMAGFFNNVSNRQEIYFFDLGLNLLDIQLPDGTLVNNLNSCTILGRSCNFNFVHFIKQQSSSNTTGINLFVMFERGTICIVKLELLGRRDKSAISLCSAWLDRNKMREAYSVARNIVDSEQNYQSICMIVNHCIVNNQKDEELLESILIKFGPVYARIKGQFFNAFKRYMLMALERKNFEPAFSIASHLNAEELYEDIYHVAMESGYKIIAYIAFLKCSKQFQEKLAQLKGFIINTERKVNETGKMRLEEFILEAKDEVNKQQQHTSLISSINDLNSMISAQNFIGRDAMYDVLHEKVLSEEEKIQIAAYYESMGRLHHSAHFYKNTKHYARAKQLFEMTRNDNDYPQLRNSTDASVASPVSSPSGNSNTNSKNNSTMTLKTYTLKSGSLLHASSPLSGSPSKTGSSSRTNVLI